MFDFLKSFFKPQKNLMAKEAAFVVVVSETAITVHRPDGRIESVQLADLQTVIIETNDTGPWGTDFWWFLLGDNQTGCVFPIGAAGEQEAMKVLQKLPGFDNNMFLKASQSTDNQRFLCWQSSAAGAAS